MVHHVLVSLRSGVLEYGCLVTHGFTAVKNVGNGEAFVRARRPSLLACLLMLTGLQCQIRANLQIDTVL